MPKQTKRLQEAMQKRNPLGLRQAVQPVDILAAAATPLQEQHKKNERIERTDKPIKETEKEIAPQKTGMQPSAQQPPKKRTKKVRLYSDQNIRSLLEEHKRQTERYSFEIYTDQKQDIDTLRDLYEQHTGKKLSASRLIREVLDSFLPEALATFRKGPGHEP